MAASMAVPPWPSTSSPACAARGLAATTIRWAAWTGGRAGWSATAAAVMPRPHAVTTARRLILIRSMVMATPPGAIETLLCTAQLSRKLDQSSRPKRCAMSTEKRSQRITVPELRARKGGDPIVCLTAYTTPMAQRLDPLVDLLLVGDSLGMVVYGFETTLPVTLDMMIAHGAAVHRGSKRACLVVDMPFGSYQESPAAAFRAAARVMAETGCSAVKVEGGREMAETIGYLTGRGIPVMGHIGLMPQAVHSLGGYRARGRDQAQGDDIVQDAEAVAAAGAFSLVIEGTVEPVARAITQRVPIPTIGIGASPACDGQVLVIDHVVGMFGDFTPKFVRRYAEIGDRITEAVSAYAADVRARRFPGPENCFGAAPTPLARAK